MALVSDVRKFVRFFKNWAGPRLAGLEWPSVSDWLILAGVVAAFLSVFPLELLIENTRVVGGDTTSHSYYPYVVRNECLPKGQIICWSNELMMGHYVLQFYFPLLLGLSGILGLFIPVAVSFKLISFAAMMMPAIGVFSMSRLVRMARPASGIAAVMVVVMMFANHNLHAGFYMLDNLSGQVASTAAMGLFFIGMGMLYRCLYEGKPWWSAGFVLGIACLGHGMLIPPEFAATYLVLLAFCIRSKSAFFKLTAAAVLCGALFSGWALPYLFDTKFQDSAANQKTIDLAFYRQFFDWPTTFIQAIGLVGVVRASLQRTASQRFLLSVLGAPLAFVTLSFFANDVGSLAVFDRFLPILLCVMAVFAASELAHWIRRIHPSISASAVCCLAAITLFFATQNQPMVASWINGTMADSSARRRIEGMNS